MTDAFDDITDTATDAAGAPSTETTTPTSTALSDMFTDNVRSKVRRDEELLDTSRYSDPDSQREADDVDPRALFRRPDINELRYYAREGPYGPTIVQKPIRDAFKHGFVVEGDNTEPADGGAGKIEELLEEYVPHYKRAKIAARRDGMAVLMHQIADSAPSAADPIPTGDTQNGTASLEGFHVWTIDNLSGALHSTTVADHTEYDQDQIYVSQGKETGGIAFVDDVSHPDHGDVVGYGIEPKRESTDVQSVDFIHADRCQHFVHNRYAMGELGNNVTGEHVGESVITPVLQPLKATQMGFWAIKEILFRYSAPLYAVEPPESWGIDDWDDAEANLENLSMASDAILPPGSELTVAEGDTEFDPEPVYDTLVQAICAGTIFTQSVLEGTQSGTVSGSETDIKGYFSEVENLRQQEIEAEFRETVRMVSQYDQSTVPRVAGITDFEINWGPLFKASDIEQVEGLVSVVTAATNGVTNYLLTPDEARSLVEQKWAELDTEMDLGELAEEDLDEMDRVRMRLAGQGPNDDEPLDGANRAMGEQSQPNGQRSPRENPRTATGGGQPEGQTRESSQPNRTDELDDETIEAIADRVAEQVTDG